LVGLEGEDLENDVTVVVNCCDTMSPVPACCKSDTRDSYCVELFDIRNMNFQIILCEARKDSIWFTDTLPNSALPYSEKYYNTIKLVVWPISRF
jgi:hypothetical protein